MTTAREREGDAFHDNGSDQGRMQLDKTAPGRGRRVRGLDLPRMLVGVAEHARDAHCDGEALRARRVRLVRGEGRGVSD